MSFDFYWWLNTLIMAGIGFSSFRGSKVTLSDLTIVLPCMKFSLLLSVSSFGEGSTLFEPLDEDKILIVST